MVSDWKLTEFDQILNSVELPKVVTVSSHMHEMKRHPTVHHNGWRCDYIRGMKRCLSGMTDFYQAQGSSIPIHGYRCNTCDFDLCFRCVKADVYINDDLINRED